MSLAEWMKAEGYVAYRLFSSTDASEVPKGWSEPKKFFSRWRGLLRRRDNDYLHRSDREVANQEEEDKDTPRLRRCNHGSMRGSREGVA